jgi:hypothetical protein
MGIWRNNSFKHSYVMEELPKLEAQTIAWPLILGKKGYQEIDGRYDWTAILDPILKIPESYFKSGSGTCIIFPYSKRMGLGQMYPMFPDIRNSSETRISRFPFETGNPPHLRLEDIMGLYDGSDLNCEMSLPVPELAKLFTESETA